MTTHFHYFVLSTSETIAIRFACYIYKALYVVNCLDFSGKSKIKFLPSITILTQAYPTSHFRYVPQDDISYNLILHESILVVTTSVFFSQNLSTCQSVLKQHSA